TINDAVRYAYYYGLTVRPYLVGRSLCDTCGG
ncbi:unnamed protein product, partial [marine sediment metagenome]